MFKPCFIALVMLIVLDPALAARSDSAHGTKKHVIDAEVVYSGLDALPWHSAVHVYIEDTTSKPREIIVEQTILTEDQQIPITVSLAMPIISLHKNHRYLLCGDITIRERSVFVCDKPIEINASKTHGRIRLVLKRLP